MKRIFIIFLLMMVVLVGTVSADTLTVNSTADMHSWVDTNGTFTSMRNGLAEYSVANPASYLYTGVIYSSNSSGIFHSNYRGQLFFNTSSLPDTAVVTGAQIKMLGVVRENGLGSLNLSLIDVYPISNTLPNSGNYNRTTFNRLAPDIPYLSFSPTGISTFVLTNFSQINTTGNTIVMIATSSDADNTSPTWSSNTATRFIISSSAASSGSKAPQLIITYVISSTSSFILQKQFFRIPEVIQANDTSTNTPTGWNWSWGDGTWSNGTTQNATHKYTKRGLFSINLLTSNSAGSNTTPTATAVRIVGYENLW